MHCGPTCMAVLMRDRDIHCRNKKLSIGMVALVVKVLHIKAAVVGLKLERVRPCFLLITDLSSRIY